MQSARFTEWNRKPPCRMNGYIAYDYRPACLGWPDEGKHQEMYVYLIKRYAGYLFTNACAHNARGIFHQKVRRSSSKGTLSTHQKVYRIYQRSYVPSLGCGRCFCKAVLYRDIAWHDKGPGAGDRLPGPFPASAAACTGPLDKSLSRMASNHPAYSGYRWIRQRSILHMDWDHSLGSA